MVNLSPLKWLVPVGSLNQCGFCETFIDSYLVPSTGLSLPLHHLVLCLANLCSSVFFPQRCKTDSIIVIMHQHLNLLTYMYTRLSSG